MLLQNIKTLLCTKCGRSVPGIETFDGVDFIENGKPFHEKMHIILLRMASRKYIINLKLFILLI